jgi:hypothetical protein
MDATTILVIVLAVLFFGGLGALVLVSNLPPKDDSGEMTKETK